MTSVLLRHASAGHRTRWDGHDEHRPLDERGRRQAAALVQELRDLLDVRRIVSSPYTRCVETVVPLAEALGLEVEEDVRLEEGGGGHASPLLAEPGVVLCTHGDVIEELLGHGLKKGAAAVFRDGRFVEEIPAP